MATFKNAAVIGTGMMGPGIAATLALAGVRTILISRRQETAEQAVATARSQIALLVDSKLAEEVVAGSNGQELLLGSTDLEACSKIVDLVIESGPEDMEFKQNIFRDLDAWSPAETVLATNTSGLSVTAIASRCARFPERVLATHFWNPPHIMPLVEIVLGQRTRLSIAEEVRTLLLQCHKVPVIVKKDRPGQLGNRLQQALIREAVNIVAEGIASVEDVDLVARKGFGIRLPAYGIFEHQDLVGLELASKVMDYVSRDLYNEAHAPALYAELIRDGRLGASSGKGFYDWSKKDVNEVKSRRDRFVMAVLKSEFGQLP